MAAPNFELITEIQTLTRRDFPLAVPTLLSPADAVPLVDGEFVTLEQNSAGGQQLKRDNAQSILSFPVHTEKGRYDTQAIGKVTILMLGMYEADIKLYAVGTGLAVGTPLVISWPATRGVVTGKAAPALTDIVVGYVTKAVANGKIRFIHFVNTFGVGV